MNPTQKNARPILKLMSAIGQLLPPGGSRGIMNRCFIQKLDDIYLL